MRLFTFFFSEIPGVEPEKERRKIVIRLTITNQDSPYFPYLRVSIAPRQHPQRWL